MDGNKCEFTDVKSAAQFAAELQKECIAFNIKQSDDKIIIVMTGH